MKKKIATLALCASLIAIQLSTPVFAGIYDGAVRDRASVNPENVKERNYKTFSPDLSEDNTIIETETDLTQEAKTDYGSVAIDEAHFPSEAFRKYIAENFDGDSDGTLVSDEIRNAKIIMNEGDYEFGSLKGIEYLKNLKQLSLAEEDLTEVDVNQNSELQILSVSMNENITKIDTKHNPKLRVFTTYELSNLADVDITENKELRWFAAGSSKIDNLDISNNLYLKRCEVPSTQLKSINISNNKKLQALNIESTQISEINTSNNRDLYEFYFNDTPISKVDFTKNWNLTQIQARSTKLKELDLSHCKALTLLWIGETEITDLDLANNKFFSELSAGGSKLERLDLSGKIDLKTIEIPNTKVKSLDLSSARGLVGLDISNTPIKKLNLRKNVNLHRLEISGTPIKTLDISNNNELTKIHFDNTRISNFKKFDAARFTGLDEFSCDNAGVEEITKPAPDNISLWNTANNKLKELNLGNFSAYQGINVSPQKVTLKGKEVDGKLVIDMNDVVKDTSKLKFAKLDGIEWDSEKKLVTILDPKKPEFEYTYLTENKDAPEMTVQANVSVKDSEKFFDPNIDKARFINKGTTLEIALDRDVKLANDGKSKIRLFNGDPAQGGKEIHIIGANDSVKVQNDNTIVINFEKSQDLNDDLYIELGKGSIVDKDGLNLYMPVSEKCDTKPVVDSLYFNKNKLDSDGGSLVASIGGSMLNVDPAVEFKLIGTNGKEIIGELKGAQDKYAEYEFSIPANTGEDSIQYKPVISYKGGSIDLSAAYNGNKRVVVESNIPEDITPGTLKEASLEGSMDDDPSLDVFQGTVQDFYSPSAELTISGDNLSTDNVRIKAVDENGVEWPTTPVPLCNATYRFQGVPSYVDPNGHKISFTLMPPSRLGLDRTYTISISLDGGKTYLKQPQYKMVIKNDGVMGGDGFTADQLQKLINITVSYVDEQGKEIAPSDVYDKVYGVTELYTLGIKPKKIDGYTLKSSSIPQEFLDIGFALSVPDGKIVYEYKKGASNEGNSGNVMLEGNGGRFNPRLGGMLRFRASADIKDFKSAVVTGTNYRKVLEEGLDFEKQSGSTIVKLKEKYLRSLNPGTYKIEVNSKTGTATATFEVLSADNSKSRLNNKFTKVKTTKVIAAQTGDTTNLFGFAIIFVAATAAFAIALKKYMVLRSQK